MIRSPLALILDSLFTPHLHSKWRTHLVTSANTNLSISIDHLTKGHASIEPGGTIAIKATINHKMRRNQTHLLIPLSMYLNGKSSRRARLEQYALGYRLVRSHIQVFQPQPPTPLSKPRRPTPKEYR